MHLNRYFQIHLFFPKFPKNDLNLLFFIKHYLEELSEGIIKKKQNSYWQNICGKKCYLLFLVKFVSTCCFDLPKKEYISNLNKRSLKKIENIF